MSYDTVATFSQVTSLLLFIAMFMAVVAYALWPRNGRRFEHVQRRALDLAETPAECADDVARASSNSRHRILVRGRT